MLFKVNCIVNTLKKGRDKSPHKILVLGMPHVHPFQVPHTTFLLLFINPPIYGFALFTEFSDSIH